jgi:hypothetical protein
VTLHVTFGESAAGSLKMALAKTGRDEQVVPLIDDLSLGPIDEASTTERASWISDELGIVLDDDWAARVDGFWTKVTSSPATVVAWFSRRCSVEYAGFLELLWRRAGRPVQVVDITDLELRNGAALAFGHVHEDDLITQGLFDTVRLLDEVAIGRDRATWRRLRIQNAPLRIVGTDGLTSASVSHFDELIVSHAPNEWRRGAVLLGEIVGLVMQTGDRFVWSRIAELVRDGRLEAKGDAATAQDCWIRRSGPA